MKGEQHQKSLYLIYPNSEDVFVNKAMQENLALNSMIKSLKTQAEKEDSNCYLLPKSNGFQMHKVWSNLLNWKNELQSQRLQAYLIQYIKCLVWKLRESSTKLIKWKIQVCQSWKISKRHWKWTQNWIIPKIKSH